MCVFIIYNINIFINFIYGNNNRIIKINKASYFTRCECMNKTIKR